MLKSNKNPTLLSEYEGVAVQAVDATAAFKVDENPIYWFNKVKTRFYFEKTMISTVYDPALGFFTPDIIIRTFVLVEISLKLETLTIGVDYLYRMHFN